MGKLTTMTLGADFTFHVGDSPAEWTLRAEYFRQKGDSSPASPVPLPNVDLAPPINTYMFVVGYSFNY